MLKLLLVAGYDIEDAIVMNKSSLDRGFGRCIVLRKYGTTMKKYKNRTTDRVVRPMVQAGQVSCANPPQTPPPPQFLYTPPTPLLFTPGHLLLCMLLVV